jgi:hypothetical protein
MEFTPSHVFRCSYGAALPHTQGIRSLGNSSRADHKAAGQVKLDRRYILWAVVGLILIMVGTVCQIVPNRL